MEINAEKLVNCPITLEQECYSMANASLDTVISALQNAELDKDVKQEVLNTLNAKCKAEAETNLTQRPVVNIDLCDGSPIELYQYGDAGADCVVKTIVDSTQESESTSKT